MGDLPPPRRLGWGRGRVADTHTIDTITHTQYGYGVDHKWGYQLPSGTADPSHDGGHRGGAHMDTGPPPPGVPSQRGLVLVLDVARFKYPPHWVPLDTLWEVRMTASQHPKQFPPCFFK